MTKRRDWLRIPLQFTSGPEFSTLRLLTKDDPPILLGRVIALALALVERRTVHMRLTDVDVVCCWRGAGVHFAEHLARVGWAYRDPDTPWQVKLTFPVDLQPINQASLNAKAWTSVAKRDARGRLLPRNAEERS